MRIVRPTTDDTARLISMLVGVTIIIVAYWRSLPYAVSATGVGVTFFGSAHACVSSSGAVPAEKRPIYTLLGLFGAAACIALVCYVAWELTNSIAATAVVLAATAIVYSVVFFASRAWVAKFHGDRKGTRGANITEP